MKFVNLVWALRKNRIPHYELAGRIGTEPSRFSRCLGGRHKFTPHERKRISQILGFNERWLFCELVPEPLADSETVLTTTARTGGDD